MTKAAWGAKKMVVGGVVALGVLVGASGCNNAGEGAFSGAALGAGLGAIVGSMSGDVGTGAAIGAAAGALGGGIVGDQNERNDRRARGQYYYDR